MGYELKQVRPGVFELVFVERPTPAPTPAPQLDPRPPTEALRVSNRGLVTAHHLTPSQRQAARAAAVKRLMRDLRELQKNPLPTVVAQPLEKDLFEWHGNLLATSQSRSFCGLVYHIIMKFPDTYPLQPPSVQMMNYISHPNIFGSYICLDMLETGAWGSESEREERYTGWSTAYSVTSVLIQLQNFLSLNSRSAQHSREYAEKDIDKFVCQCGHKKDSRWPPIAPEVIEREIKEREEKMKAKSAAATSAEPPKPKSIAEVDFAPPVIRYGLFRRYREESFPFRLPELRSAIVGSRSTEAVIAWKEARVEARFRGLTVDLFSAERGYTIYQVTFDERGSKNPFRYWGEIYPAHDLHNIKEGLSKLASGAKRSLDQILAQKEPFQFPAKADVIEFRLNKGDHRGAGGLHCMTARYNLGVVRNVANRAWQMVAVDETNKKNLLVLDVISNGFDGHFVSSARFYLHSTDASDRPTPTPTPTPASAADTASTSTSPAGSSGAAKSDGKKNNATPPKQANGSDKAKPKTPTKTEVVEEVRVVREEKPVRKYVPPPSVPLIISANFGHQLPKLRAPVEPKKKPVKDQDSLAVGKGKEVQAANGKHANPKAKQQHDLKQKSARNALQEKPMQLTFYDLPPEMQLHIFSFLEKEDLFTSFKVNAAFADLALDSPQWGKDELVCFHSKRTDEEDVLGIPVNFELYPKPIASSRPGALPPPKRSYDNIQSISSTLDLLSYESYTFESVRRGVWKEKFTHWLPLYISKQHGVKALPLCEKMIAFIMTGDYNLFEPIMAVEVFTKLMNTMIVSLMSGETHASEKAMEGYFSFHHWLLVFIERYPELLNWINDRIEGFVNNPDKRIKKVVPSLGEFIPLLAVTDKFQWKDIAEPFILEVFDRNQKWVLQKYPALGNMQSGQPPVDKYRLLNTFQASQVSMRLVLFHVYFLNTIAKPKGRTVSLVRRVLDACYGRPSPRMKVLLQKRTKELQKVDNWVDFFVRIDMPLPTPEQLTRWLQQSVWNSSRKRYHNRHDYTGAVRKPRRVVREEEEEDYDDRWNNDM